MRLIKSKDLESDVPLTRHCIVKGIQRKYRLSAVGVDCPECRFGLPEKGLCSGSLCEDISCDQGLKYPDIYYCTSRDILNTIDQVARDDAYESVVVGDKTSIGNDFKLGLMYDIVFDGSRYKTPEFLIKILDGKAKNPTSYRDVIVKRVTNLDERIKSIDRYRTQSTQLHAMVGKATKALKDKRGRLSGILNELEKIKKKGLDNLTPGDLDHLNFYENERKSLESDILLQEEILGVDVGGETNEIRVIKDYLERKKRYLLLLLRDYRFHWIDTSSLGSGLGSSKKH